MNIAKKIDKYLKSDIISEAKISKNLKKFMGFCEDYGLSKQKMNKILRKHKNDLDAAVDEMMEEIRDEVSPDEFDEADDLYTNATI